MRIGTDNSTIHAVGRCLEGTAGNENDVLSFLQFAGTLIFAEQILVSSTELDWIVKRSKEVCSTISKSGIDSPFIHMNIQKSDYDLALRSTAKELIDDMIYSFDTFVNILEKGLTVQSTLDLKPAYKSSRPLHRLITTHCPDHLRCDILSEVSDTDVSLMPEQVIAENDYLVEAIRNYVVQAGWSKTKTAAFDIMARFRYNTVIYESDNVKRRQSAYLPHATRGRMCYDAHLAATAAIDRIVKAGVEIIAPQREETTPNDLPLLADSLIVLGKEDPIGVLNEVARLRSLAEPVREVLSQVTPDHAEQVAALTEFEQAVKSKYSGCSDPARFRSVLGVLLGIAGRFVGVDISELNDLRERKRRSQRSAVFSELVRAGAKPFEDPTRLKRFVGKCTRKYQAAKK